MHSANYPLSITSILVDVFQINLNYTVIPWFPLLTALEDNLWECGTTFDGPDVLLIRQLTAKNSRDCFAIRISNIIIEKNGTAT